MPKIAIAGKGGVGKTMIASTIAYILAFEGNSVYAIDADPNPTLGQALGFPIEKLNSIRPILSLRNLISERVGKSNYGSYFTLNPYVNDIPEQYSMEHRSIRLLIMGSTQGANTGCACTENAIVKALVNYLILQANETIIMDMVAGTEHLGRGTASGVDAMLIIVEPSMRSIQAGQSVVKLTKQYKNMKYWIVGNKIRNEDDRSLIAEFFLDCQIAGYITYNPLIIDCENKGDPVFDLFPEIVENIRSILQNIKIQKFDSVC